MKIEKIEPVGVNVKNLDEAVKLFSDILGTTFVNLSDAKGEKTVTEHADPALDKTKLKLAADRRGLLLLVESDPPLEKEGLRSIRFKVPDIEQAKAELKQKGIRHIADLKVGSIKGATFSADDLHGVRLVLVEYEGSNYTDAFLK